MVPIYLRHITKKFGETTAVDAVDLDIFEGELFFLLGPSGCGKTTLLRMIAGLIEPNGGAIHFGDRDVTHLPTGKRNAAMVFQSYALWPHMSVSENVAFGLDVRKVSTAEKTDRVKKALAQVQMTPYADRRPPELSGGQQQRVALARALVVNPDVLLLDEPLSNLDAKLRIEMRNIIRHICKTADITGIYVTHDQSEALSMADRLAVMKDGRVMAVGTPDQVYNNPPTRFVADFIGSANFIPGQVSTWEPGRITIKTAVGDLTSTRTTTTPCAEGQKVVCSIRPEAFRLLQPGQQATNTLTGKQIDSVYLGDMAQHVLELTDGSRIDITEIKPRLGPWDASEVQVGFDADDCVVLAS